MSRETGLIKSEVQPLVHSDQRPALSPPCDVYENNDEILIVADLPGVTSESLEVNLDNRELTIAARRALGSKEGAYLGMEFRDCDFQRRFAVPSGIDADKIRAELKNGVLALHLPKSEALKPRQIAVRAG